MGSTMTSREFNRDVSAAKRASEMGPVTITDHGRRSHVLLTAAQYDAITGERDVVGDRLRMATGADVDLVLPVRGGASTLRVPDL